MGEWLWDWGFLVYGFFAAERFVWLWGILQTELTRKKWRLAAAVLFVTAALALICALVMEERLAWVPHVALIPVIWIAEMIFVLLVFEESKGRLFLKYFFVLFYRGILASPARALFTSLNRWFPEVWGVGSLILYLPLMLVVTVAVEQVVDDNKVLREKIREFPWYYYAVGLALGICAAMVGFFMLRTVGELPLAARDILELAALLVMEGIYLLGIGLVILNDMRLRYQRESLQKSHYLTIAKEHYRSLEEHLREVRRIKHDMKHQMAVVRNYLEHDEIAEAKDYLDTMEGRMAGRILPEVDVGNELVNGVIADEMAKLPEGVALHCRGKIAPGTGADDYDLCIIFSNLLSNAREACEKIREPGSCIELSLRVLGERTVLTVENPVGGAVRAEECLGHTSKEDAQEHGYGLLNVREAVERNEGTMKLSSEDGKFTVTVIL